MLAFLYYPGIQADDPSYSRQEDIEWCLARVGDASNAEWAGLAALFRRAITSPSTASSASAARDSSRLSNNLGVTSVVFMVVAAAAPLTVVGGVMPLGFSGGNGLSFPVMFLVAALTLTLFSVGLSQMARVVPKPGLQQVPKRSSAVLVLVVARPGGLQHR